jgi:membrane protease YdiL (CAAX protease family)
MLMTSSAQQWLQILSSPGTWIYTILLSATFPVAGYLLFRSLKMSSDQNLRSVKLRIYGFVILSEWAFVAALLWLLDRHGLSANMLGENMGDANLTVVATIALLAVFALLVYLNIRQLRRAEPEKLEAELAPLKRFLPGNRPEYAVFMIIAFTAGICEELLYRGWLQNLLAWATGSVWIGLVLGAAVFGCGHAYQGKNGMIQSGVIGLIFGAALILTKSLVAGQILHVTIDAVNGIVGGYALSLLRSKPVTLP